MWKVQRILFQIEINIFMKQNFGFGNCKEFVFEGLRRYLIEEVGKIYIFNLE